MLIYLQIADNHADQIRFAGIYEKYKHIMYCVAKRIVNDHQDSEDAVQDAFVGIVKNMKTVRKLSGPMLKSYLLNSAGNAALNIAEKRSRRGEVSLEELTGTYTQYDGEDELTRCILQLPLRQRQVILLKYYHGYTLKEIAKVLNITGENAKKIHQRAKRQLREIYEKEVIL